MIILHELKIESPIAVGRMSIITLSYHLRRYRKIPSYRTSGDSGPPDLCCFKMATITLALIRPPIVLGQLNRPLSMARCVTAGAKLSSDTPTPLVVWLRSAAKRDQIWPRRDRSGRCLPVSDLAMLARLQHG